VNAGTGLRLSVLPFPGSGRGSVRLSEWRPAEPVWLRCQASRDRTQRRVLSRSAPSAAVALLDSTAALHGSAVALLAHRLRSLSQQLRSVAQPQRSMAQRLRSQRHGCAPSVAAAFHGSKPALLQNELFSSLRGKSRDFSHVGPSAEFFSCLRRPETVFPQKTISPSVDDRFS
jgi:hypothetical protein